MTSLEQVKEQYREGTSKEKEKAATADNIEGAIYNYQFLLSLSSMVDVYKVYGSITNTLQV